LRKPAPKRKLGMDDQRDWVLRNDFLRNFRQTFHKDETDMIKETGTLRRRAFFYLNIKQLCGKFTIKEFRTAQSV
jgi:hypothetical protein